MRDGFGRVQRVLLVGGASEIGCAVVAALPLVPGAAVVLAGRDRTRLEEAILPAGVTRQVVILDVTDLDAHTPALDQAMAGGDLDVAVVAVGVLGNQQAAEHDPDVAAAVLSTNFVGPAVLLLHLANRMRSQGHGSLVVLSSVAGRRPRRDNFIYGASKAGLDALSEGLGDALAGSGVHLLVVRPGFVRGRMTDGMTPAPFATSPVAVGAAVAAGLAAGKDTIHVPAVLGPVTAGLRLLPRPLWRHLKR